ncbi:kinase-like protein [Obba rivulosa]|uniref:Kinase-like protein n=1 Tax=Obba rivulosa TaxID=1052685 RepID=A0A8E2DRW7_9APHY|nr:kinase-like protein [Obba rivulosa]
MELRILELIGKNKDGNSFLLSPHTAAGRWAWQSFNGFAYVVTELCPGGDLSTRRRSLSPAQLQVIVAELVIGLEWLHDRDIVHHDIKPSNILIDGDGHCVISDFGGARMKIQDGPHQGMLCRTAKTDIVCTKPYAAPELVDPITFPRQTELYYTESIDYWSVGVTIVTLITGEELLTGNRKRREEELESVGERLLDVRVASDLVYLVYELLEPIPSRRWTGYWLKEHPYFDGIDWEEVMRKRHVPPFAQCRHARPRTNGRVLPQYEATHATDVNYLPVILQAEGLSIEKDDSLDLFEDCRDLQARMARAYDTYGPCSQ